MSTMTKASTEYRDGNGYIVEIIRANRRKTVDLRVEDGAVSIVVPHHVSLEKVTQIVTQKRAWIQEKLALHREAAPISDKEFVSGEAFPYLGRNYRLKVEQANFEPVRLVQGRLVVRVPQGSEQQHMVRNALVRWYKRQAEQKLREKVARFAPLVGVKPTAVNIRSFKSRWGSCTAQGKLEFNWQITMAPNRMVDYVVIHELCHLLHHDHSSAFWREVSRVMPDYAECRLWLRENGEHLRI